MMNYILAHEGLGVWPQTFPLFPAADPCSQPQDAPAGRTIPGYTDQEPEDIFAEALHVACTPARVGTSYEATSTNGPIFWVIHTPIERQVGAARGGQQQAMAGCALLSSGRLKCTAYLLPK